MGPEVHKKLTRQWALEEGFSEREAELISLAGIGFDRRYPARASLGNITRHFAPAAWLWSRMYMRRAMRWRDLLMLGYALHCAQDAVSHGTLGEKHLEQMAGWGRNPDIWGTAPPGIQRRVEAVTRSRLRRYRASGG
ncbi:MAG: hypothetical protein JXA36_02740 [Coriobacteriia bacterium]|nr:hypothetical protein [Coriobacteriia bacterium]